MFRKRIVWIFLLAAAAWAARQPGEPFKPGFNLFSKEQDVQLGQANAKEVMQQYPAVEDQFLQNYVKRIGERLASAPEARKSGYPFTFTVLNVDQVNAFALPGGPMFIFTGLLKAVDSEAQLAGVMGHEMAHVILRHGTNQASKANLLRLPAMLAGGLIGTDSAAGQLANLGLGLGANSYLLKFSRDAESDADALGSYMMANAGYNPVEMATFFQKLGSGGGQGLQFFSDHPNPGNREKAIRAELPSIPHRDFGYRTGDFEKMKQHVASLPAPPKKSGAAGQQPVPAAPSASLQQFRGRSFSISYPANWQAFGGQESDSVTLAPREGIVTQNGASQIGYGAILSYFVPDSRAALQSATDDLIHHLRADNPRMQVVTPARSTRAGGAAALITRLGSASPFGGNETDALLTVLRPEGLFYLVFVAPENQFSQLQSTFDRMVASLRF